MSRTIARRVSRRPILAGFATLGIAMFLAGMPSEAVAQCKTETGRPCTGTEELVFCVENSMDAYYECKDDADGFLDKAFCLAKYELDFYMCIPKALK